MGFLIMLIAVIILAWLLVNTWLTLILVKVKGTFFSGWDELAELLVYAVISPFLVALIYIIAKKRKKNKKKEHQKNLLCGRL